MFYRTKMTSYRLAYTCGNEESSGALKPYQPKCKTNHLKKFIQSKQLNRLIMYTLKYGRKTHLSIHILQQLPFSVSFNKLQNSQKFKEEGGRRLDCMITHSTFSCERCV